MDNEESSIQRNVLGGTIHIFKTKEQMGAATQTKEETNATKEDSN